MTRAAYVTAFILTALPQLSSAQTTAAATCNTYYAAESTYSLSTQPRGGVGAMGSRMVGAINRRPVGNHDTSIVLELENGYPRMSFAGGVRQSRTVGDHASKGARAQVFGQMVMGAVTVPDTKGTGGLLVQPGVGISYGDKFALHAQLDYRWTPGSRVNGYDQSGPRFVVGFTRRFMSRSAANANNGACIDPEALGRKAHPPIIATPPIEFGFGFNGPQYWTAEFPGITLSAALNRSLGSNIGASLIGEYDAAYVRPSATGGARIFATSTGRWRVKIFAQALVGVTSGAREGIIQGYGGRTTLVGAGVMLGTARRSFLLQVDHRHISGGHVVDEQRHTDDAFPSKRITVGVNFGLGKH